MVVVMFGAKVVSFRGCVAGGSKVGLEALLPVSTGGVEKLWFAVDVADAFVRTSWLIFMGLVTDKLGNDAGHVVLRGVGAL